MLQKLRSNRSVLSVGPMGTWTWTGPIGPRDQDGPDQSVLEIPLDRVEPIKIGRSRSVSVRSRPRLSIPDFESRLSSSWRIRWFNSSASERTEVILTKNLINSWREYDFC